jgi:hypothetical protein
VWDKLASGAYVADLYVDLPKGAPNRPWSTSYRPADGGR